MRNTNQEEFHCIRYSEIRQFLIKTKTDKIMQPLCVHVNDAPLCPISRKEIQQPVLASDGVLYEKESLVKKLSSTQAVSSFTQKPFEEMIPQGKYQMIRLACKYTTRSLLHPEKNLTPEKSLVLFARSTISEDHGLLFVEKRLLHEMENEQYNYGQIDMYHLRPVDIKTRKVEIEQKTWKNLEYSMLSRASLLNPFEIDATELAARSYYMTPPQLFALENRIFSDQERAKKGLILYYKYSNKASILAWVKFWGEVAYNSCNWAVEILHHTNLLTGNQVKFDKNFKFEPLQPRPMRSFFLGATPNRVAPFKKRIQKHDDDNIASATPLPMGEK
ncbi:MAG: hypothetical protein A3F10_01455 [Coxiella sp. RIFCSPHIGHO2_12_FULL_42_15]|nr:MAG: hypothetical protein A3F10_01455 [Coxiella sp. RIFCSPHIGHO2_12_FULL_42_15]